MEEIARYECFYNRNSKDFKDKNKKANSWGKIGKNFNLSAAEAEVKFRVDFHIPDQNGGRQKNHCYSD